MDDGRQLDSGGWAWMFKWMPEWTSKQMSEWSWMSKIRTCRYKEMLLGMRTEAGIRLEVDKHAGEP